MVFSTSMGVKVRFRKKSWWVVLDHQGRRRSKKIGDRVAAHDVARELRSRLVHGDLGIFKQKTPSETFAVFADRWLREVSSGLKASTHRFYEFNLRLHVIPVVGQRPVASFKRADCRDVIAACRAKQLKPSSLRGVNRTLSAVLSQAVEDELLPANPAFRMGKHLRTGDELPAEIQPFSREEAQQFLDQVEAVFPHYAAFFLCALRTGMRLGELLALHWSDVVFAERFIEVRRNKVNRRITSTKGTKNRRVDMSLQLRDVLLRLRTAAKQASLKSGTKMDDHVFLTPDGSPIDGDNLRTRVFYRVLERAGLRRIRLHDLRHTNASLLIQQNESLVYVQKQLGHSSIQVTVDVYGHLIPGANRGAVDTLDVVGSAGATTAPAAEDGVAQG